jgi:GT2 family glycosyltransferase
MTFTIGYAIHNKGYMLDKIIDGLVDSIPETYEVKYVFILDGCSDNSKEILAIEGKKLKNVEVIETPDLFELRTNNILMKSFDTDFLIIFQDDMVLKDSNFLANLINVYSIYGDNLGLVGCRDGFNDGYSDLYGSEFSDSKKTLVLKSGDYAPKLMLNRGPIIFTKNLIEKIGLFDEAYNNGTFEEMEYCLKCHKAGLINVVMGIDLIHSKFDDKAEHFAAHPHTHQTELKRMYKVNHELFSKRWYHIAKI